ncbi:MAG: SBBP repeat-containing protein [Candidatus Brocadia sp.]|nr:SBBP repeat-containing protein [Candidatus Brocadia sp.]
MSINEHGELVVETEFGPVKFTKPVAYQEIDGKRVEVECGYVISDFVVSAQSNDCGIQETGDGSLKSEDRIQNTDTDLINPKSEIRNPKSEYGFKVAAYDKTKELVIDPLLASTFLGGSYEGWYSGDKATALVLDTEGNVYVAGITYSRDFPVTNGAYDTSLEPSWGDVFVSKLDSGLTSLIASTFLGGWNYDLVLDLALDSEGNVYVTGETDSWDFPTTSGAYDTSFNRYEGYPLFAPYDAFVSKLNSGLTRLLASTFLGGSDSDYDNGNALALDTEGNVYVTGTTYSRDFPTTSGAYDTSLNGGSDVFISKLNSGLTKLIASTLLGGSDYDVSEYGDKILALDKVGNVYVTGDTRSSDFPTTVGAYDTTNNGVFFAQDAFVSKLDSGLTNLLASTFLRGLYDDESLALTLDTEGNVYVAGYTYSSDFPTTSGAYDTSFADSGWYMYPVDSFVSKLDSGLANLIASTFLGGYDPDLINALALDSEGNVYVAGNTYSSLFPITSDAYDTSLNYVDAFVSKLDRGLTNLLASTFLGGLYDDESIALALDSEGNVYVTGKTDSWDFPTTSGAYDTSFNNDPNFFNSDAFVSKLDSNLSFSAEVVFTIESSSDNIRSNESVNISGTVTLKPNDEATRKIFLQKEVKLFRISPTGYYEEIVTTKPFFSDNELRYEFNDVLLPEIGSWEVYCFYDDGDGFRGTTSETLEIDVESEQKPVTGYAILIEGKVKDGSGIDAYNLTSNDIYKKLLKMGFTAKNIYYANFDDTQKGVDAKPDKEKILDAITKWAKKKMNKKAAPLYIIFVGPGEKETLFIGSETLTAGELSESLNALEAGLNPEASKKDIVVTLGANRSGSFIDSLSRSDTNRVIITSADTEEVSYQGPLAPDGTIRQGDYFVYEFFRYATMGMNVKGCYEKAADTIAVFTNNKNGNGLGGAWAGNGSYFDHAAQHPLMDDNGDKVGTARVFFSYNGDDGDRSRALIIGKGKTPSLEFTRVTDVVTLELGDTTPELFAEISDTGESNKAWVEIESPQYGLKNDKESREQQVVGLPRYSPTGFDEENRRYTWNSFTIADFKEPGKYGIFYFAQNVETGDITPIVTSDVYKEKDNNGLQGQYLLNLPKDNGTTSVALTFDWTADGKDPKVTYTLTISESPTFDTVYYQQKGITEDKGFVDLSAGLLNGATYYWRVLASDDEGRTEFIKRFEDSGGEGITRKGVSSVSNGGSTTNRFTPEAGSFYILPIINGYVVDKITGEKIDGAFVNIYDKNGTWETKLRAKKDGFYESFLPHSGKYNISASSYGYADGEKIINANSGKKKLVNMEMEKEAY